MHRGFTRDYRKVEDWEWYKTPHMYHLFRHLIREANYKDGKWQGIEVKRGQLITGRKALSFDTGIPEQSIRTCLDRLKSTNEITIKVTSKFSIITICNYDTYQFKEDEVNQQNNHELTNNQPASNQQVTTNNNYNNINNNNNIVADAPVSKTKRFIKPTPQEATDYAKEVGFTLDGEYFCNFYESKGWLVGKTPMKDWKSCVRTWKKNNSNKPIPFTQATKTSGRNAGTYNENGLNDYSIFDKMGKI